MSIPYVRATFWHLREASGACELAAYLGRTVGRDARLKKRWDFRHRAGDVVHAEVIAPSSITAAPSPAELAQLLDRTEAASLHKIEDRQRWPQVAVSLVIALPPDSEASLDDAVEIVRAIVDRVVGEYDLISYLVVHDPSLKNPLDRNRHAHVLISLREMTPSGEFTGNKIRDILGRVRNLQGLHGPFGAFVEGIHWPDLSRDIQMRSFAEWGTDLMVDPISPVPQRHWSADLWWNEPERVHAQMATNHEENLAIIRGDPAALVDTMLRDRSSMSLSELRKIGERVLDAEHERRHLVDRVLAHPGIVAMALPGGPTIHVTTTKTATLLNETRTFIEQSADSATTCAVVRAANHTTIIRHLTRLCRKVHRNASAEPLASIRLVAVGRALSHTDEICNSIRSLAIVERATIADVQKSTYPAWTSRTVVVVPHTEAIPDTLLAHLIVRGATGGARLLCGFDESRADGIASCRLAAWIASRIAVRPSRSHPDAHVDGRTEAARLLRVGLIAPAMRILLRTGCLHFRGRPKTLPDFTFSVIDDPRQVAVLAGSRRQRPGLAGRTPTTDTPCGTLELASGDFVVFERTYYSCTPPVVRQANLATVIAVDRRRATLRVSLQTGAEVEVDLKRFPHVRPAHVLTVREARRAPPASSMRIMVTSGRHAYACLLLAATHQGKVSVDIMPTVARNATALVPVIERHLPTPLPWHLEARRDERAENHVMMETLIEQPTKPTVEVASEADQEPPMQVPVALHNPISEPDLPLDLESIWLEPIGGGPGLQVKPTLPKSSPQRIALRGRPLLSTAMRGTIEKSGAALAGFEVLQRALAPTAANRTEVAARVVQIAGTMSPTAQIVATLMPEKRPRSGRWTAMNEVDFPATLQVLTEGDALSIWDLWKLRVDLSLMALSSSAFQTATAVKQQSGPDEEAEPPALGF